MYSADKWEDYELIDASDGERLERWGKYILIRPDPQIIWKNKKKSNLITMIECRIRGDTSTNEIATGDDIGYMLFHL